MRKQVAATFLDKLDFKSPECAVWLTGPTRISLERKCLVRSLFPSLWLACPASAWVTPYMTVNLLHVPLGQVPSFKSYPLERSEPVPLNWGTASQQENTASFLGTACSPQAGDRGIGKKWVCQQCLLSSSVISRSPLVSREGNGVSSLLLPLLTLAHKCHV